MPKQTAKRLYTVIICTLLCFGMSSQGASAAKPSSEPKQRLIVYQHRSADEPRYSSMEVIPGETVRLDFDAYLQSYDGDRFNYFYAKDVVDTARFKIDEVIVKSQVISGPSAYADLVKASFDGNTLTIQTDASIPENTYIEIHTTAEAEGCSRSDIWTSVYLRPNICRLEVKPGFLYPVGGKTSKLDLVAKQCVDGQIIERTDIRLEVLFSDFEGEDPDAVNIKDCSGTKITSGDRISMDQLPLSVTPRMNGTSISLRAYGENDQYLGRLVLYGIYPDSGYNYFNNVVLSLSPRTLVYNGKAQEPKIKAIYDGKVINEEIFTKPSYYYLSNTDIGTASVLMVPDEKYGFRSIHRATFQIVPQAPMISTILPPQTGKGLVVSWEKVPGISGYRVFRDGKAVATIRGASNVTYTDPDAKTNGTRYMYRVRAYKTVSDKNYWSAYSAGRSYIALTRTTHLALTNPSAKTMKATWKKNTKADGFQIQYAEKSSFAGKTTVKITNAATVSKTIRSLVIGKTYYVRVRAYKGGCHSAWSPVKKLTIVK